MNIEEKLQDYIKAKYGSIYAFTKEIGMANSTFATLMKRGIHSASITSLIKICKALDISVDELAQDRITPNDHSSTESKIQDLKSALEYINKHRYDYDLTIDGKPLTPHEWTILYNGIEITLELIRKGRKEE